jgi:SAM-dependent methyltransferase
MRNWTSRVYTLPGEFVPQSQFIDPTAQSSISKLRTIFQLCDRDGSMSLSLAELELAMKEQPDVARYFQTDDPHSKATLQKMLAALRAASPDEVSWPEFLSLYMGEGTDNDEEIEVNMVEALDALAVDMSMSFLDWSVSRKVQGEDLQRFLTSALCAGPKGTGGRRGGRPVTVLDANCHIGTAALGLMEAHVPGTAGFAVLGCSISSKCVEVAQEAATEISLDPNICMFKQASVFRLTTTIDGFFDVVMAGENLLAFALDLDMLMMVLVQLFCKLRPGGMLVLALYDYDGMIAGSKDINVWEREICSRPLVFKRQIEDEDGDEPLSPTSIAAMKKRKKSLILGKKGARDNSGWTSEDLHWQVFDWDSNDIARRKYTLREFSLNRPAPKTVKEEYNHRVVGTEVQIKHRAWLRHEISDALEVIGLVGIRWSPPTQLGSGEWLCNCFRLTNH